MNRMSWRWGRIQGGATANTIHPNVVMMIGFKKVGGDLSAKMALVLI